MIGPFTKNPFGRVARFSPLDTRPKKDSDDLRVILNLSHPFPKGSVNHSISKTKFLGKEFKLKYPSCDDLIKIINKKGKKCKIFKRDLLAAYRQMYMDPGSIHLLGYVVENRYYFDITLSMGSRSSCICCQLTTDVIKFIFHEEGFDSVNYLDDLGGAEVPLQAEEAFRILGEILQKIGIIESEQKACAPATKNSFLGILFDTEKMIMEIEPDRLEEIKNLLELWFSKKTTTLKEIQQILGKLNFLCSTVRAGRVFVSRIINMLKDTPVSGEVEIEQEFLKDLRWWYKFMEEFDGTSLIPDISWKAPDVVISTDATLSTCGGWSDGEFWHCKFPVEIIRENKVHINELEALAVMVGIKIWQRKLQNTNALLFCDNQTTVSILNTGKAKNVFAQNILREVCYILAKVNGCIKVVHKPGVSNRITDFCSRIDLDETKYRRLLEQETLGVNKRELFVYEGLFKFENNW